MGVNAKEYPAQYFVASGASALINYPLWRASAIAQAGFHTPNIYLEALSPPYKGALATVTGMTWARAAIFYGSDAGKDLLLKAGFSKETAIVMPPFVVSTIVQIVNMPLVRATVTIQDPQSKQPNVYRALRHIYKYHGMDGLWHGTSAGVLKTVPKYCTAIIVKDVLEEYLSDPTPTDPYFHEKQLYKSAVKSIAAGVAGAVLTNPLDVIRNEMFKTNLGLVQTTRNLYRELGWSFLGRGVSKNTIAVAIPVACTIFFTDVLIQYSKSR